MPKYKQNEFPNVSDSTCEAHLAKADELSAYIDKELPAWKRPLIRRHLKKCPTCANQVHRLQQINDFLRRGGEIEVSDDFLSSVMKRVSQATKYQKQSNSLWPQQKKVFHFSSKNEQPPFTRFIFISYLADKLRYSIRTRSPVYIFVLTFAVFTMVGATLYQSPSNRFGQSVHALKKSQELNGEKLISFEVIQHEPPKRLLTTYPSQRD